MISAEKIVNITTEHDVSTQGHTSTGKGRGDGHG